MTRAGAVADPGGEAAFSTMRSAISSAVRPPISAETGRREHVLAPSHDAPARSASAEVADARDSNRRRRERSAPVRRAVSPNARARRRCHGEVRSSASSTAANSAELPIRDRRLPDAEQPRRGERERQNIGVGGDAVAAAERLDRRPAGIRPARPSLAKHRAEIGIVRPPPPARWRGGEANGDRVVRPERQLGAVGAAGQEKPPAKILAGKVDEDARRLDDRRLDEGVAGVGEKRAKRCE